jgi:hypothetical protein
MSRPAIVLTMRLRQDAAAGIPIAVERVRPIIRMVWRFAA